MFDNIKGLTQNKTIRILFAVITSFTGIFASIFTVADAMGYSGNIELFIFISLLSLLLSSNAVWIIELLPIIKGAQKDRILLGQIKEIGVTRTQLNYEKYVLGCRREIRLWGLGLATFTTDRMIRLMVSRLVDVPSFNIRILILNPDSSFARYRADQASYKGMGKDYFNNTLETAFTQFRWMGKLLSDEYRSESWRARFDVRYYDGFLSMGMVVFDDDAIISHYYNSITGSNAPYVIYQPSGSGKQMYQIFLSEFDDAWNRSKSVFDIVNP